MNTLKSAFLHDLMARGFFYQCTDLEGLDQRLQEGPLSFYIGFDATADSLHVGHLMTIMLMRLAQKHGHQPLVLMGGGTTLVGDPSGRDTTRQMLTPEIIQENIHSIQKIFSQFLTFGTHAPQARMINNADWLLKLNYLEFLREYGQHFSINRMLTFDSVKLRLDREQPLSFLEFNYMILQGYDFLELFRNANCTLQVGGSDQWGNILNGIDLIRRVDHKQAFGLTVPLITTSSGTKMGKTVGGAVWLNKDRLSAFDYWQFWRNTEDADVIKFLKIFTDLSLEEIRKLESLQGAEINDAKKILADEATILAHGKEVLESIHHTVSQLFEKKSTDLEIVGHDTAGNPILQSAVPILKIAKDEMIEGIPLFSLLTRLSLCSTNSEARRLIQGGGCRVNEEKIMDEKYVVTLDHIKDPGIIQIASGKKKYAFVQVMN
jgi:tyrosyl-tRNA synthetase